MIMQAAITIAGLVAGASIALGIIYVRGCIKLRRLDRHYAALARARQERAYEARRAMRATTYGDTRADQEAEDIRSTYV